MSIDYKKMMLETRLEAAKDSITRARYVILICVLASLALIVADLNGYFSWYRFFILAPKLHGWDTQDALPDDVRHHFLVTAQDQLIKSWVDSLMVSIPPLGLRFGVSDIAIVGPAALSLLMIVLWYATRRENRAIVGLLRETADGEGLVGQARQDMRGAVYYAISSHLVFLPVGEYSDPMAGLQPRGAERHSRFVRLGYRLFIYLPLMATLLIGAVEVYSNEIEGKLGLRTFRDNLDRPVSSLTVVETIRIKKSEIQNLPAGSDAAVKATKEIAALNRLVPYLETVERANGVQTHVNNIAPLLATLFIWACTRAVSRYSAATIATLREYHDLMNSEMERSTATGA
jgi:hypothetical protein